MRREFAFAPSIFLFASFAAAQQATPPTPPPTVSTPTGQTAYYAGSDVTAPELLPPVVSVSFPKHCNEYDGVVKLSAIIETNGIPRNIHEVSGELRLVDFAIELIAAQRFKPGAHDGVPSPVAIEATLGLHTCWQRPKGAENGESYGLTLRSHPVIAIEVLTQPQAALEKVNSKGDKGAALEPDAIPGVYKIGANISKPILLNEIEAEYSDYGRKERIQGICVVSLIVDAKGVPQNVHVIRSLEPSLDDNAVDAVKQWRFKPAMKDGTTPVPVMVTVEVDFHLYKQKRKLF
jgi:TonB family protein